ncbi:Non-classical phosphatidylinositol transfer protein (PITP) [Monascus purpureus]|uniref:Phosphatidylinositol transfer protein SFH5 n=1 Tax=Monascus purpureus TaxID=5098 RepID=A0A507QR07_MONPU|nr:Non-classical phosphatidylinositol transfer protein (PITP) [Monascus purpureus]BDD58708.1 Non-classical phosphatidylinositol transfer protein [Monascus purpureus]
MSEQPAADKPAATPAAEASATATETSAAVPESQPTEKQPQEEATPVANGDAKPTTEQDAPALAPAPASTAEVAGDAKAPEESAANAAPAAEKAVEAEPKKQEEEAKPAATEEQPAAEAEKKPDYLTKNPALSQFFERLSAILSKTEHGEMWGVPLKVDYNDIPTINILIKFLRANEGNVKLAEEQLTKALEWRKKMDPVALLEKGSYNAEKFDGLGYKTIYKNDDGKDIVVTWNIYGSVNSDVTFGNLDEFLKWRVALMELAIKDLKLGEATSVLDYTGEDPYQMIQVHDYQNVSFLRMNPNARSASRKTIEVFSTAYPELLKEKFFVNVPAIMGWMFAAMKVFLSKNTTRKFHPISNGANLAREFPASLAKLLPKVYGGQGPDLKGNAETVKLEAPVKESSANSEAPKEEPAKEDKKPEAPQEVAKEESKAEETKGQPATTETAVAAPEAAEAK